MVTSTKYWNSLSEEERKQRSDRLAEVWSDPKYKARLRIALQLAFSKPEVKARLEDAKKKARLNPSFSKNLSKALKKAYADPAIREKVSNAVKAAMTPVVRAKISAAGLRRWSQEGAKEKHSLAMKKALASPEVRKRMGAKNLGRPLSPEHRAKMSAAQAARQARKRASKQ